jgi:hypothetical protein
MSFEDLIEDVSIVTANIHQVDVSVICISVIIRECAKTKIFSDWTCNINACQCSTRLECFECFGVLRHGTPYWWSFLLPTADKGCKRGLWFFVLSFVDEVIVEVLYIPKCSNGGRFGDLCHLCEQNHGISRLSAQVLQVLNSH